MTDRRKAVGVHAMLPDTSVTFRVQVEVRKASYFCPFDSADALYGLVERTSPSDQTPYSNHLFCFASIQFC